MLNVAMIRKQRIMTKGSSVPQIILIGVEIHKVEWLSFGMITRNAIILHKMSSCPSFGRTRRNNAIY
jgi:hypothetical protein